MTIMIVDNDCDGYDCQQCNDHDGYDVVNNHGVAISYDHLHSPSVIGLLARFFLQSWVKNVDSEGNISRGGDKRCLLSSGACSCIDKIVVTILEITTNCPISEIRQSQKR